MKRLFVTLLLFPFLLYFVRIPAGAQERAEPAFLFSADCSGADKTVTLRVSITPGAAVAGFRLRIAYDDSALSLSGTKESRQLESGTMRTNTKSNPICSIYVCNTGRGYASTLSGTIAEFYFQVRDKQADLETNLCACVDETCDYSGNDMGLNTYEVLPVSAQKQTEEAGARLAALVPSEGELEPAFQPDITAYRLNVESSVNSIIFRADGESGSTVVISRKSLEAPGSQTPIRITVTSADGKEKSVYLVTVCRAEKEETTGKTTKTKSPASSGFGTGSTTFPRKSVKKSGQSAEQALASVVRSGKKKGLGTTAQTQGPPEESTAVQTVGTAETAGRDDRQATPLTIRTSEFPPYLVGMIAAGFCGMVGALLCVRAAAGHEKKN